MKAKVLIIDDEDIFREDLASLLRHRSYECQTASDGEGGLIRAEEFQPDIIFCDVVMPGMNGFQVFDKIISRYPHSSVVIITAFSNPGTMTHLFRKGAVDYMVKPLGLEEIVQKINNIMENKEN